MSITCPTCPSRRTDRYETQEQLRIHCKAEHTNACAKCDKVFKRKTWCEKHEAQCKKTGPTRCFGCGYWFARLHLHVCRGPEARYRRIKEQERACHICMQFFRTKKERMNHYCPVLMRL
jgi:hypothetical protein